MKHAVLKATLDNLESLERMEDQGNQEDQELQADQVVHQLCAQKLSSHHATLAHLDHPAPTGPMEHQETTADQVNQADQATQADQANQATQAHQDLQEAEDPTDHPELQAEMPSAHQTFPEIQDHQEKQDHQVFQETMDHPAEMDNPDHLATVDHLDHPDLQERTDLQAQEVLPAHQDKLENVVFARNTVHWMVAFSSKTEAEGSRSSDDHYYCNIPKQNWLIFFVLYSVHILCNPITSHKKPNCHESVGF